MDDNLNQSEERTRFSKFPQKTNMLAYDFADFARPICLPSSDEWTENLNNETVCLSLGWDAKVREGHKVRFEQMMPSTVHIVDNLNLNGTLNLKQSNKT